MFDLITSMAIPLLAAGWVPVRPACITADPSTSLSAVVLPAGAVAASVPEAPLEPAGASERLHARLAEHAPLYARPGAGLRPRWRAGSGFLAVAVEGPLLLEGGEWYRVGADRYARAEDLHLLRPTAFHGLAMPVPTPSMGWATVAVRPVAAPGLAEDPLRQPVQRYQRCEILATAGDTAANLWYRIGEAAWLPASAVRQVRPAVRPRGIGAGDFWVAIDLGEQTVAAYEGDRMVYASLISSGRDGFPTPRGLFTVWKRWVHGSMSGLRGTPEAYAVADVTHALFFHGGVALHGAYWHDKFGEPASHGCVNIPPLDAEWIYRWSEGAPHRLRVWVFGATAPKGTPPERRSSH